MKELIKVTINKYDEQIVSARDLHRGLEVRTRFSLWVDQNFKLFKQGTDFESVVTTTLVNNGATRELQDYALTVDMAKQLALMSRTAKGAEYRDYFIELEKAWNTPEKVMARALKLADKTIHNLQAQIEADKPKTLFADAVTASKSTILVGELAKLLKQNGIDIGQNRLFNWLRSHNYLINRKGSSYNMPTQKSMELGLFEIKETAITHSDGHVTINKTPKITGKGQQYFVNRLLNQERGITYDG